MNKGFDLVCRNKPCSGSLAFGMATAAAAAYRRTGAGTGASTGVGTTALGVVGTLTAGIGAILGAGFDGSSFLATEVFRGVVLAFGEAILGSSTDVAEDFLDSLSFLTGFSSMYNSWLDRQLPAKAR